MREDYQALCACAIQENTNLNQSLFYRLINICL
jgi:hypothetical protein